MNKPVGRVILVTPPAQLQVCESEIDTDGMDVYESEVMPERQVYGIPATGKTPLYAFLDSQEFDSFSEPSGQQSLEGWVQSLKVFALSRDSSMGPRIRV